MLNSMGSNMSLTFDRSCMHLAAMERCCVVPKMVLASSIPSIWLTSPWLLSWWPLLPSSEKPSYFPFKVPLAPSQFSAQQGHGANHASSMAVGWCQTVSSLWNWTRLIAVWLRCLKWVWYLYWFGNNNDRRPVCAWTDFWYLIIYFTAHILRTYPDTSIHTLSINNPYTNMYTYSMLKSVHVFCDRQLAWERGLVSSNRSIWQWQRRGFCPGNEIRFCRRST